jgi:hypothetical protein
MTRRTIFVQLLAGIIFVSCAGILVAGDLKDVTWQTGMLRDITTQRADRFDEGTSYVRTLTHFTIDAEDYTYVFTRETRRHDKALDVVVNAPIKWGTKKGKFYLMDGEGKAHEVQFEKKSAK